MAVPKVLFRIVQSSELNPTSAAPPRTQVLFICHEEEDLDALELSCSGGTEPGCDLSQMDDSVPEIIKKINTNSIQFIASV